MCSFDMLKEVLDFFVKTGDDIMVDGEILKLAVKVIGVGYITEFTADIVEDFGNKVIASKVVFGGKVVVCGITLPIIKKLFVLLLSFCWFRVIFPIKIIVVLMLRLMIYLSS